MNSLYIIFAIGIECALNGQCKLTAGRIQLENVEPGNRHHVDHDVV